jgi:flavin-binding protein dodecin
MIKTRIAILSADDRDTEPAAGGRRSDDVPVTKVIEVIGSSTEGSDDAVRQALAAATRSVRGITRIEVMDVTCEVADGTITRWDVLVKMLFPVEPR